ncbi:MAG: hypothetical protein ACI4J7_13345 [Ruminiclostridium sp.]
MSRFTKATLFIAGLALAVAAETAIVSRMFIERGGFFIGGEWLIPAVAVAIVVLVRQFGKLYKNVVKGEDTNGKRSLSKQGLYRPTFLR